MNVACSHTQYAHSYWTPHDRHNAKVGLAAAMLFWSGCFGTRPRPCHLHRTSNSTMCFFWNSCQHHYWSCFARISRCSVSFCVIVDYQLMSYRLWYPRGGIVNFGYITTVTTRQTVDKTINRWVIHQAICRGTICIDGCWSTQDPTQNHRGSAVRISVDAPAPHVDLPARVVPDAVGDTFK